MTVIFVHGIYLYRRFVVLKHIYIYIYIYIYIILYIYIYIIGYGSGLETRATLATASKILASWRDRTKLYSSMYDNVLLGASLLHYQTEL